MVDEVTKMTREAVEKGGILAKLYFDMQSEKQEDLQPLMTDLISNRLLKTPGVLYCFGEVAEPIKVEEHYTTNAVVTALFKDVAAIVNVAFNYAPAGVEILKPEKEIVIRTHEMQAMLSDISQVAMQYSQFILQRVLSKEDYEKAMSDLRNREELGKKLIDKDGK
ncbi:MAG: hypothetical protein KGH49_01745 [Candidatus Micrarchaeota archaeon]|nr:hypothetical protein [Candidatus Micrarchaeota archaeon]